MSYNPFVNTPIELITEILLFGCGDCFDADNPFAEDRLLRAAFVKCRSAFRAVEVVWRAVVDHTAAFWACQVFAPNQARLAFDFLTSRMLGNSLNIRLILRGPAASIPPARSDEIGIRDIIKLLQVKSDSCGSTVIRQNYRAAHRFPRLIRLGLINIGPVWRVDKCVRFQPVPGFLAGDGVGIRHVRLVGFALSFRDPGKFRDLTILVLDDLDHMAAPTTNELYGLLQVATAIEDLSIGGIYRAAGNSSSEELLRLLRAPGLIRLDVKLMGDQDWFALLKCEQLVCTVVELRVFGFWRHDLNLMAMSTIMPHVKVLDVMTADQAMARCAGLDGFMWTNLETLLLRNPRFESLKTILTVIKVARLHIHYPYPTKFLSYGDRQWALTKVSEIVMTEDWMPLWRSNTIGTNYIANGQLTSLTNDAATGDHDKS
ncbi:hypothetical protein B0H14DRAFT_2646842 [Mycena olivaceomarginata]|nr:hypothetical protein B0H14DRAFT_2646842 [Mycena olivaceomarginata]